MATNVFRLLFAAPETNPANRKAKSIPVLNPLDPYGRVFFFSWLGFMVAFLSWYAFPPLLTVTIKQDLHLTQNEVANSNIIALLATFLVRLISGPLCDRFGPRLVFIGLLLAGSIPTAMAGLVTSVRGLMALRFFIGILGGSFVPCQAWTTAYFDKNIIGTANALTAGWGNAGGGITFFVMPAVFNSLVSQGLTPHKAWRVAYIVPSIIIATVALGMLFTCEDTPTGKWSERMLPVNEGSPREGSVEVQSEINVASKSVFKDAEDIEAKPIQPEIIEGEIVMPPSSKEFLFVISRGATLSLAALYACSFGSELAIESILSSYYAFKFPYLGQTKCSQWAAMFGLLNVFTRPLGGFISDIIFRQKQSVWAKKIWLASLGVGMGSFMLAVGLSDPESEATMFGLCAGMAFLLEAANGANFSVVPHVYPAANGIVSGTVGAAGNLGGIIFGIIFRYNGTHYSRSIWIIGIICLVANLGVGFAQSIRVLGGR